MGPGARRRPGETGVAPQHPATVDRFEAVESVGGRHQHVLVVLGLGQELHEIVGAGTGEESGDCAKGAEPGATLGRIKIWSPRAKLA